ncbi:aldo/keto reductase [Streptomyces sp. SID3343]|uniref:aldo/keto reductase n=1 Tax=Streptomyces sp. SID3343 TaxID=2690260 RepID=UPI00136F7F27|nr:aldo/keto reductase [Streptomyces sp. SID3343]MYW02484.1 aldo/keto reductase [Streptomyces sp. SID3343]
MSPTPVPTLTLNDGAEIPQLGFGVFQVENDDATTAVASALEAGYRSIDTAAVYGNEAGVGRALAQSDVPRDELFVTTKLWNTEQGYDSTLAAFEESLRKLGLDYVDMYLIHWPAPARDRYLDTWRAFEKLRADGRVRTIGVSNFQTDHTARLAEHSDVVPAVNQIELHPYLQQRKVREFDASHGIRTEAWSPLGKGGDLLKDPVLGKVAKAHGKSTAQVVLRWHLQLGNIVIPKSVTPSRIRENFDVFDFELSAEETTAIDGLDRGRRMGPDPDETN